MMHEWMSSVTNDPPEWVSLPSREYCSITIDAAILTPQWLADSYIMMAVLLLLWLAVMILLHILQTKKLFTFVLHFLEHVIICLDIWDRVTQVWDCKVIYFLKFRRKSKKRLLQSIKSVIILLCILWYFFLYTVIFYLSNGTDGTYDVIVSDLSIFIYN